MQQQMPGQPLDVSTPSSRKSVSNITFEDYDSVMAEYRSTKVNYQYVSVGLIQGYSETCHWLYDGIHESETWNYLGGIGIVTDEMFESRYEKETRKLLHDFPSHVWFANDFLAYLCGEGNNAPVEGDSENLVPIGNCEWQHRYDPPMREWEDNPPKDFLAKELIRAKVGGRQYIWRLRTDVECPVNIMHPKERFTLGTWVD